MARRDEQHAAIVRGVVDQRAGAIVRTVERDRADRVARLVPRVIGVKTGDVHVAGTRGNLVRRAGLGTDLGLAEIGLMVALAGRAETPVTLVDPTQGEFDRRTLGAGDIKFDEYVVGRDDRCPQLTMRLVVLRAVRPCDLAMTGVVDEELRTGRHVIVREAEVERGGRCRLDAIAPDTALTVLFPGTRTRRVDRDLMRDSEPVRPAGRFARCILGRDLVQVERVERPCFDGVRGTESAAPAVGLGSWRARRDRVAGATGRECRGKKGISDHWQSPLRVRIEELPRRRT
jgi:hypothetical protein